MDYLREANRLRLDKAVAFVNTVETTEEETALTNLVLYIHLHSFTAYR